MATAKQETDSDEEFEERRVNSHAVIRIGKSEAGDYYEVRDRTGNIIKEEAIVAGQGTIYVGNAYTGENVSVRKVRDGDGDPSAKNPS